MKLYKEDDLGKLNMAGRLAYIRSLASKYNLKESIQNSYGVKVYVYYLNPVCNTHILNWCEESDHVRMATVLRTDRVDSYDTKDRLYAYEFQIEYSTSNIERRLTIYTKQAKEFMVKYKIYQIEKDFK